MRHLTLVVLAAIFAAVLAEGQFYVPRAYYTIDSAGHESLPIPLRRLRRSASFYPQPSDATATANANANAESKGWNGANANANADAKANSNVGSVPPIPVAPISSYGSSNPALLRDAN